MAPNVAKVCNETFKSAFSTSFAVTNELFTTASKQYDDINLEGEEEEVQTTKKSISVRFLVTESIFKIALDMEKISKKILVCLTYIYLFNHRQQVTMNSL